MPGTRWRPQQALAQMHPETTAQTNPTAGVRMRRATTQRVSLLALVPLHQFFIRGFTLVVPLQAEGFLAKNGGLETSPRLDFKVIERPAMGAEPVRSTGGKVDERAGFDFFEVVFDFNHTAAFKGMSQCVWPSGIPFSTSWTSCRGGPASFV